jgi:hypothetical protein
LDRGVFYPKTGPGVVWNGLTSVKENPSDVEDHIRYVDGVKTHNRRNLGVFAGSIEAYTYPSSFYDSVLAQRRQTNFGLTYRTEDKIHLVYNISVAPSTYNYESGSTEPFRWNFTTLPVEVPGSRKSSHLVVDTSDAYSWTVEALEAVLYGTVDTQARLPMPDEVFQIFEDNSILQIIDHGDGSWTAIGPDEVIQMLDTTTFQINWPSAIYVDEESYTIHSL